MAKHQVEGLVPVPSSGEVWQTQSGQEDGAAGWAGHPGKKFFPKKFGGVGKPFKPLPNAIKKKRVNFRLRKLITPKSPVMVLNEMVGSVTYNFVDPPVMVANNYAQIFVTQCEVEGKLFTGTGPSKQIAKNICAEQAIQAVVTNRCLESREKIAQQLGQQDQRSPIEDETPWAQLASLALFKLFNDWQNQGFHIPAELLRVPDVPSTPPIPPAAPVAPATQPPAITSEASTNRAPTKKIPENPTSRHPVQLLNELRGGVVFNVTGEAGSPPNTIFTMSTELDGRLFKGEGRNKKEAKKNCALVALREIYNIVYPDNNMDVST